MSKEAMVQIAVRIPKWIVDGLDQIAEQMGSDTGMEVTRANVVRSALKKYVEGERGRPATAKKAKRRKP